MRVSSTCPRVIKVMLESGDLAAMGGSALKVYLIIKANEDQPPLKVEEIAKKAGLSEKQVMRGIKKLAEFGYLMKERQGRGNSYSLPTPSKPIQLEKVKLRRHEERGVPGFIYVASNPGYPGLLKIGQTTRQPEFRLKELSDSSSAPASFELAFSASVSDIYLERDIHRALDDYRFNQNREFFTAPLDLVISTINQYVEALSES